MIAWTGVMALLLLFFLSLLAEVSSSSTEAEWQTWGPYRPNLYFGVRPLVPESFLMGLMWASGESQSEMLKTLRDTCEQDDGMQGYGWTTYDTRFGGSQTIHDSKLHIDLDTDFVKSGGSWAVRVTGTPRLDPNVKTTVIFHAAIEGATSDSARTLVCGKGSKDAKNAEAACHGSNPDLGSFEFLVLGDRRNKALHATAVKSVQVAEDKIWQAKSVFTEQIKADKDEKLALEDGPGAGNMQFIQMSFRGRFTLTFTYGASGAALLDSNSVQKNLNDIRSAFPTNVDRVFPRTSPFEHKKYAGFSQALLSNLLGGLGFFHGDSRVDLTHAPEYDETDLNFWKGAEAARGRAQITSAAPTSLLSHTPSRPFFPRGFLWDEGFHLLPIVEWDLDLAVSVLKSWLSLMDDDGWIGREQILGAEARSRVPVQFQVQYPHYANPPTLIALLLPVLLSKITGTSPYNGHPSAYVSSPDEATAMLKKVYPLLSRHYAWFRRTQAGNFSDAYPRPAGAIAGEGYRWRGRTPMHTLTSGLDDYPRANPPHPGELHVDALAWVGGSAHALQQLAEYLRENADAAMYKKHLAAIKHNLDTLHWDEKEQAYCDATIDKGRYSRVCHQGYMSLFPLLTGLMDADHPNLPSVLNLLSDPSKLWSTHGLRSLSVGDAHYGKDEDYWRGAVWMNLNVLAVQRLRELGLQGPVNNVLVQARALSLAGDLRTRLVNTVFKSWERTGFIWEQYNDKTGEGSHSRAFTGWTACVILLMGLDLKGDPSSSSSWRPAKGTVLFALGAVVVGVILCRRRLAVVGQQWHGRCRRARRRYEPIDLERRR